MRLEAESCSPVMAATHFDVRSDQWGLRTGSDLLAFPSSNRARLVGSVFLTLHDGCPHASPAAFGAAPHIRGGVAKG
ncbi:hypothetical protein Q0Z83_046770 [Actinoplanes sichuanensis]|nr:hypothetical protein Q0Z83_046770 [Actinoplanes sichuanensis]